MKQETQFKNYIFHNFSLHIKKEIIKREEKDIHKYLFQKKISIPQKVPPLKIYIYKKMQSNKKYNCRGDTKKRNVTWLFTPPLDTARDNSIVRCAQQKIGVLPIRDTLTHARGTPQFPPTPATAEHRSMEWRDEGGGEDEEIKRMERECV